MRRLLAALVIVIAAPVIAELLYGTISITKPVVLLIALPMYGGGALLIREVVRRSGRGWASILLLGAAFGVVEEGLALQSFFNPTLYHAADWGARFLGVNWVYLEAMLPLHAIWSVAIPILLSELMFRSLRGQPYLGRFGLVVTGLFYVIGVGIFALGVHTQLAPGYWAPPIYWGLSVLAVFALAVIALRVLPKQSAHMAQETFNAPHPLVMFLGSGIAAFLVLALPILLTRAQPIFAHGPLLLVPMAGAIAVIVGAFCLLNRWSNAKDWNDNHLMAVTSGALIGHTLCGIADPGIKNRQELMALGVALIAFLAFMTIRIRHKVVHGVD